MYKFPLPRHGRRWPKHLIQAFPERAWHGQEKADRSRRTQKPVLEAARLNPGVRQGLRGSKWLKVLTNAQVLPAHL